MKTYKLQINGRDYEVVINGIENNEADVTVNGQSYQVKIQESAAPVQQRTGQVSAPSEQKRTEPAGQVANAATVQKEVPVEKTEPVVAATGKGTDIVSPLPGVILDICVKEGDQVKEGQKVMVLEAMKMENEILAECDGVVTRIHVGKGESVLEEAKLVTIG